jgi:hypothetical protein
LFDFYYDVVLIVNIKQFRIIKERDVGMPAPGSERILELTSSAVSVNAKIPSSGHMLIEGEKLEL